jgi:hypothetical protein
METQIRKRYIGTVLERTPYPGITNRRKIYEIENYCSGELIRKGYIGQSNYSYGNFWEDKSSWEDFIPDRSKNVLVRVFDGGNESVHWETCE